MTKQKLDHLFKAELEQWSALTRQTQLLVEEVRNRLCEAPYTVAVHDAEDGLGYVQESLDTLLDEFSRCLGDKKEVEGEVRYEETTDKASFGPSCVPS